MPTGTNTVVLKDDQILLIQREDFEVWNLPGGGVDAGESPAQCAVREVKEETGIDVKLSYLVGIYTLPRWTHAQNHTALFVAEAIGGELTPQAGEAIDVRWWDIDALPEDKMMWWQKHRIAHALAGKRGIVATQDVPWNFPATIKGRADLYKMRDDSGLSRMAFAFKMFDEAGETQIELGE